MIHSGFLHFRRNSEKLHTTFNFWVLGNYILLHWVLSVSVETGGNKDSLK